MRSLASKCLLLLLLVWGLDMFSRESHQRRWWDCGETFVIDSFTSLLG